MAAAWTRESIDCVAAVLASRESEHEHLLALNAGFEQARRSIAALRRKDCATPSRTEAEPRCKASI
jgi:hypothetical protein